MFHSSIYQQAESETIQTRMIIMHSISPCIGLILFLSHSYKSEHALKTHTHTHKTNLFWNRLSEGFREETRKIWSMWNRSLFWRQILKFWRSKRYRNFFKLGSKYNLKHKWWGKLLLSCSVFGYFWHWDKQDGQNGEQSIWNKCLIFSTVQHKNKDVYDSSVWKSLG